MKKLSKVTRIQPELENVLREFRVLLAKKSGVEVKDLSMAAAQRKYAEESRKAIAKMKQAKIIID